MTDKLTGESSLVPNVKLESKVEIPIKIKGGKTSVKLKFLEEMARRRATVDGTTLVFVVSRTPQTSRRRSHSTEALANCMAQSLA